MLDTLLIITALIVSVVISGLALFVGLTVATLAIHQDDINRRAREDADCDCYVCEHAQVR